MQAEEKAQSIVPAGGRGAAGQTRRGGAAYSNLETWGPRIRAGGQGDPLVGPVGKEVRGHTGIWEMEVLRGPDSQQGQSGQRRPRGWPWLGPSLRAALQSLARRQGCWEGQT